MKDIILHGDVFACLESINDNTIAVAITSPPYWKQRDYGFKGQVGQESTPEEYIGRLLVIFSKLRQKMRGDGVFFLNIGDKYLHQYGKSHLLQIPYRLAYHMLKDGWYLEDIIIWYKPNHMPSSVKDRFANVYEPVLVFSKSDRNIYKRGLKNVVEVPLQQTPWLHTAVFPEKLVYELLKRVDLKSGDIVIDPFAGTGTVGAVVKSFRSKLLAEDIFCILIEKEDLFIDVIKERTKIKDVKLVEDLPYYWKEVIEEELPEDLEAKEILLSRYGEVFIADSSSEFLSVLKGITTPTFKDFHREDALYFFGVKDWDIRDLYYVHSIFHKGYLLRNMVVISDGLKWYPVFMFAKDSTRVSYRFYLDRIRIKPKSEDSTYWSKKEFLGMKVRDLSKKAPVEGKIISVVESYKDHFPKIVVVRWDGSVSLEFVLHPEEDEFIMEGLVFKCPKCGDKLEEPFDPVGLNICPHCKATLWETIDSIPIIVEPREIKEIEERLREVNYSIGEIVEIENFEEKIKKTKSKFVELERVNWGASPGARKTMLGEYFTKVRLYRIDQPMVARYLNILRKEKGLSIKDITDRFPSSYIHTVGHWFRKDFGGSIPVSEDIVLLKEIIGEENGFFSILERTALKFQTVKASIKGRNPGDFIKDREFSPYSYFSKLFIPSIQYASQERDSGMNS